MTAEEVKTAPQAQQNPKEGEKNSKPTLEKQTNCLTCNKPLKKIKLYYRNGKFYCSKKCWRKGKVEKEAKK